MYADPHALLRLAAELRARGSRLRRLADAVVRDAAAVDWHGASADAMRRAARLGRDQLDGLADQHDRAADLLTEHAHLVAHRLSIVLETVDAAVDAVQHAVGWLRDAA